MSSKSKKSIISDGGAPQGLITSLLVGLPFLSVLVLHDSLSVNESYFPSFALASLLIQGLAICFYWRRLSSSNLKMFVARLYAICLWVYLFGITAAVIASVLSPSGNLDYIRTVASSCMFLGSLSGLLFLIAWALENRGKKRFQKLALTMIMTALGASLIGVSNLVEITQRPDGVAISADDFDDLVSEDLEKSIPDEEKLLASRESDEVKSPGFLMSHIDKKPEIEKEWSYVGSSGPDHWGSLSAINSECEKGHFQSPINIPKNSRKSGRIQFIYKRVPLNVMDVGNFIRLGNLEGNHVKFKNRMYNLVSIRFHNPSEHTMNSIQYPAEIQLTHKDEKGRLLKIGVLVEIGSRNTTIDKILNILPREKMTEGTLDGVLFDPLDFIPQSRKYFLYSGSKTIPPCTQGVSWLLMEKAISVSSDQLVGLQKVHEGNIRPIQPLGSRKIGLEQGP